MDEQKQNIKSAPDLRKWRIELPNLIDDSDLSPFEFRLLVHYYRVGNCWESVRTTADKCNMSVGMVVKARENLVVKEWIKVSENQNENGTLDIIPLNRWSENFQRYSKCSCGEQGCSCGEQGCSCGEPKKEPFKKEPIKKEDNEDSTVTVEEKTALLVNLYEENIGFITPIQADILKDAAADYPMAWYEQAFKIAVSNNARNWQYVGTILGNWKKHGYGWKPNGNGHGGKNGKNRRNSQAPEPDNYVEELEKKRARLRKQMEAGNA